MTTPIRGIHPITALFPPMEPTEFEDLIEDVRLNGQPTQIVIDGQGRILTGCDVYRACQKAGAEPVAVGYSGNDPSRYALRANMTSHLLDKGQTAMILTRAILVMSGTGRGGLRLALTLEDSLAASFGVSNDYLRWSSAIIEHVPHLIDAVTAGTVSLADAYEAAMAKQAIGETRQVHDEVAERREQRVLPHSRAERAEEIRALAAQGMTRQQVAEATGISAPRLSTYAAEYGIQFAAHVPQQTRDRNARADRIRALAEKGNTSAQIAQAEKVGRDAVKAICFDYHIDVPADRAVGIQSGKRYNATQIVEHTALSLEGLAMGIDTIPMNDVDRETATAWLESLDESLTRLMRFRKHLQAATTTSKEGTEK